MNILLRSDGGPIEGFRSAAFRVAISDEGFGEIVALPEDVETVSGTVVASVDGVDVFAWRVEDREAFAGDIETVTVTGRGRLASLERAIVLPEGYPNFTTRTRAEQGPPFAVWADLLVEAQGRGRAVGLTPTWTESTDSEGQPWQEVVDFGLEPGVTLADLLREVAEVEGAEWIIRPDGSIDAARGLGVDRSSEVVLFVGHNQISRGRRESSRNQRQTVFLEASTGVSEVTNDYTEEDAGEIWLEGQDFADPISRTLVAEKIASKLSEPEVEVEVAVDPDCGVFDRFNVGDVVGLDTGRGTVEAVRVIGAAVSVTEEGVEIELTLVSQVELRQQQIDRAIEAKADVKLAANTSLQRRHGLVTADKFLSGAVGEEVAISSENYTPGVQGWVITGDGDAEFNDATFRGDLQSSNYDPEVAGWRILNNGEAEFNDTVTVSGTINAADGAIGGFTIDADKLQGNLFLGEGEINGGLLAGCRLSGGSLQIGGAEGLNANTSDGLWVGDAQFGDAPFRVDLSGNLTATSGSISGELITEGIDAANITVGTLSGDLIVGGTIQSANIENAPNEDMIIRAGENINIECVDLNLNFAPFGFIPGRTKVFGAFELDRDRIGVGSGLDDDLRINLLGQVRRVANFSSARYKDNIRDAPMFSLDSLRPVTFNFKPSVEGMDPTVERFGLIAEEAANLGVPGLVGFNEDGLPEAVDYKMVGMVLVQHVKDLQRRVNALESGGGEPDGS